MVSSVPPDKFDLHKILKTLLPVLLKSCMMVTLTVAGSHIPFGIGTNEDIEEVSSTLTLWLKFKLETPFINKIQNNSLMSIIFNKISTLLANKHFSRNRTNCIGYVYIEN